MRTRLLRLGFSLLAVLGGWLGPACARAVTDDDVTDAIARGRKYLLSLRNPDGSFTRDPAWRNCYTSLILMTLAYMGEHPNSDVMGRGMNYLLALSPGRDFNQREGYALPIRVMAIAYLHDKLTEKKRARARRVMQADLDLILAGQFRTGGWRYQFNRSNYDFSASQWPILALFEAGRIGIEFPRESLLKARAFYFRGQKEDGGWTYQYAHGSYGSMTAAGLASLQIIADLAEPASGCPCRHGHSRRALTETERRMDAALAWLVRNFSVRHNPGWPFDLNFDEVYYWLYCLERVGITVGYKHFGRHNWYKEGAEFLLARQGAEGSWEQIDPKLRSYVDHWGGGKVPDTCFALLFLYKGRAPVLFNKLRFDGIWNPHRRDVANLTRYAAWAKEQQFHWQVVDLAAPLEELHDAPVLFICAETPPKWTDAEKAKLRAFTDTGGTILLEASCGNPLIRQWVRAFAKEVWPEWPLEPLGPDHPVFRDPYPLQERPELLGIGDGLRTFLYYADDDVSCPWHTRAFAGKEYLFRWGINLYTCATDHAPLRAKLARQDDETPEKYQTTPRAGPRRRLRLARLRTSGDWQAGANYGALARLAGHLEQTVGLTLVVEDRANPPVTDGGVRAAGLRGFDIAYLTGSGDFRLTEAERGALEAHLKAGGFLWAEAAGGAKAFDEAFRRLAQETGWTLAPLPKDHPVMTGRMGPARGYDLTSGVSFRRALRIQRVRKPWAELVAVMDGQTPVGLYSPLDVTFSLSPYEAYGCRGYRPADAAAVVTNILLHLTTRPGAADEENARPPKPPPAEPESPLPWQRS